MFFCKRDRLCYIEREIEHKVIQKRSARLGITGPLHLTACPTLEIDPFLSRTGHERLWWDGALCAQRLEISQCRRRVPIVLNQAHVRERVRQTSETLQLQYQDLLLVSLNQHGAIGQLVSAQSGGKTSDLQLLRRALVIEAVRRQGHEALPQVVVRLGQALSERFLWDLEVLSALMGR